jgi:superfamily I DNA and/or RNA helicase
MMMHQQQQQVDKIGFLSDRRRMNVALTRARRALWVVGDLDTLRTNPDWEELVIDAERRGLVVDVAFDSSGNFELKRRFDGDKHTI